MLWVKIFLKINKALIIKYLQQKNHRRNLRNYGEIDNF